MSEENWQYRSAADGMFELWLPPGAELVEDEMTLPGETLLYWSPHLVSGVFVILRQAAPAYPAGDMLDLERNAGKEVTVELDERVDMEGRPARHLRYHAARTQPREAVEDPATGTISYLSGGQVVEITEYLIWQGQEETITVGYAIDVNAPPDTSRTFAGMLERFRLLKAP